MKRHSAELSVSVEQPISAPARLVRQQFGDVAHHEATGVHRGVEFEALTDGGTRCRYRQSSKVVGPVRLRQELELIRDTEGPLVNRIVKGQFTGSEITFDVVATDDAQALVRASLRAPLAGVQRLLRPVLARIVERGLTQALLEDKRDLESGTFQRHLGISNH